MDFSNLLESTRTYASWTFALFILSSRKENDKESNMSSLNYASYFLVFHYNIVFLCFCAKSFIILDV